MSFPGRHRVAAALLACLLLTGCSGATGGARVSVTTPAGDSAESVGITTYAQGQRPQLPAVSGATLDGSNLALSSLQSHVVVLNVWASWCEPCRTESPALAKVAKQTAALGVRFVGIDEQDRADSARSFAASAGASYPHLIDPDGTMLASLRLVPRAGIPSTLVLDGTGLVAARIIGPVDGRTLESLVRTIVAQAATKGTD